MADNDVKIKVSLDGADSVQKGLSGVGTSASDADSKTSKLSGGLKGAGAALVGFSVAAAAAGGALVAGVVSQYAAYEQNIGGIETMFKGSAGKMEAYAADAYKTAGLSANEYMAQATSFSAALLQGLGGDTDKAADIANRAMTDMSDNANKFGTNIGMIQNAYQGFAKNNYTMLDNLKLGYGGTASEMARLVNDAGLMEDGFVATAANINDVSYDKIIASIGAIQDEMGVTGTTAKEASETISGSIGMLQGAFANLMTGLGSADADVATLAGNMITSLELVIQNITPVIEAIGTNIATLGPQLGDMASTLVGALAAAIPAVLDAGVALVGGLIMGITSALPTLIAALIPGVIGLVQSLVTLAPQLLWAGVQAVIALAQGISSALPTLIPLLVSGIVNLVHYVIQAAPLLLEAGLQLITALAQGLLDSLPVIIAALPTLIEGIVAFIVSGVPMLLDAAIQLFTGILDALPTVITQIVAVLPTMITSVIGALLGAIPLIIQAGITLLTSLVTALPQIITSIVAALPLIITSILTAVLGAVPMLIQAGIDLFIALIGALPQIIIAIVGAIPQIITGVINALVGAIPQIIMAGVQLLVALISNMPAILGGIIGAIPQIITGIVGAIVGAVPELAKAGLSLIQGLWKGISNAAGWLMGKIGGFVDNVMGGIKDFFGIKSPSLRMNLEVGTQLPAGIGLGVEKNEDAALKPIQDLNAKMMDEALSLNTTMAFTHDANLTQTMVPAQYSPQAMGPVSVEATLDPYLIGSAITDAFAATDRSQEQASVSLSRESINSLASAIVDSIRVQSRQGVSVLG